MRRNKYVRISLFEQKLNCDSKIRNIQDVDTQISIKRPFYTDNRLLFIKETNLRYFAMVPPITPSTIEDILYFVNIILLSTSSSLFPGLLFSLQVHNENNNGRNSHTYVCK